MILAKYFYSIGSSMNDSSLKEVSVVEQTFWKNNGCVSDIEEGFIDALFKAFESLGGYECLESVFEIPIAVTEEQLVTTMLSHGILFETTPDFSDFIASFTADCE